MSEAKHLRGWCFPADLEEGQEYCPGGYDTDDPSAWSTVSGVEQRPDEVIVYHAEDDGDSPGRFDTGCIVHVRCPQGRAE